MDGKKLKNPFGYVIVKWEVEPRETERDYPRTVFMVLDAGKALEPGGFKYYGKKTPKNLKENIGEAVLQAHWH